MIWAYIGIYTFFLAIIWGFFIVIKIHAFKFKSFSEHITKITYTLFLFLIILSISGYLIIFINGSNLTYKLDVNSSNESSFNKIEY